MKILLTFDTGYAPHAATVMESIIQNCAEKLEFAVIYYDLTSEVQEVMSNHFENKVKNLTFYKVDETVLKQTLKNTKTASHLHGFNTFLRIFAPLLLPTEDKHIIYLDCDVIVLDDIRKMGQNADLSRPICAVKEYDPQYKLKDLGKLENVNRPSIDPFIFDAYWYRSYKYLKMDHDVAYFNAGVMIINLDYWRKNNISEKLTQFLTEKPNLFSADQDALNSVLNGNFGILEQKWNDLSKICGVMNNYTTEQKILAYNNPSIVHFGGSIKPWHYLNNSNNRKDYWKYRMSTPWNKKEYADKITLNKWAVKNISYPAKSILKFLFGRELLQFIGNSFFKKEEKYWSKARILNK
jgi:lipopolysaccharide biosynthesis glycosyltransferase